MERGDFDALPGPVYVRSYLRTYAIYVNLDPRKLNKIYQAKKQSQTERLSRTARVQQEMELQNSGSTDTLSRSQKQDFGRTSEKMVTMSRASVKNKSQKKKSKTKDKKNNDSGFAKFYNVMLMVGFLLLLIVSGVIFYLHATTSKVAEISDKVKPLTVSETSVMLR
jgi:cytoskeletal protein RodZ